MVKTRHRPAHPESSSASTRPPQAAAHGILRWHSAVGNRAVAQRLQTTRTGITLQRAPRVGTPAPVQTPYQVSEALWTSLLAFSSRATPDLQRVGKHIRDYLDQYDVAYASFAKRLDTAQKEAADRKKWADVMAGIIVGAGVGLAAGHLLAAATIVRRLAAEVVAEGIEAATVEAVKPAPGVDFKPPPELNNDRVARGYFDTLAQAGEAIAVVQAATLAFSPLRDALRDAELGTPARGGRRVPTAGPDLAAKLEQLRNALVAAEQALKVFVTTCDIPLLWRGKDTIEQDLWIAWMAQSSANAAEAMDSDDTIGARTRALNVIGRVMPERELFNASVLSTRAREERTRIGHIGKVGVVVIPPRFERQSAREYPGIVHFRPDAYDAVGRKDPGTVAAASTDAYQKIVVWDERAYFRPGEVVMVVTTKATGLRVERHGGQTLSVTAGERQTALRLLGITEPEYRPEAGEALSSVVWYALEELRDVKPPLQAIKSEDGVLVTEADGTKLVLVAPRTSDPFGGARERQRRLGVPTVIVVALTASGPVEEVRREGIVITASASAHFIAGEIRAARGARRPQPAPAGR